MKRDIARRYSSGQPKVKQSFTRWWVRRSERVAKMSAESTTNIAASLDSRMPCIQANCVRPSFVLEGVFGAVTGSQ